MSESRLVETVIEPEPRMWVLCQLVLAWLAQDCSRNRWPYRGWRHHGIGVLQAYITEGARELRVHIWHPDLVVVPEDRGDIHDHRFAMTSSVLCGRIRHEVFRPAGAPCRLYDEYEVTPYRDATVAGSGYAPRLLRGQQGYAVEGHAVLAGQSYSFLPGVFHHTVVSGLAVTLVEKRETKPGVKARILSKAGEPPVDAFAEGREPPDFGRYIALARQALESV